jgi:glycosyltransferase involved in cell wall biosynthesis
MKRIAIVHDWFTLYAGSEKVVRQLLEVFPGADLFGLIDFLPKRDRERFRIPAIRTSFLQKIPGMRRYYRYFLPVMPLAIERMDFSGYDLILSSSHAVSKGLISGPDQLHISYIHAPVRYAWGMEREYLESMGWNLPKRLAARGVLGLIRRWDVRAAQRPDRLVANSEYVAGRIRDIYHRKAAVIHPPVDTEFFTPGGEREGFYLAASRLVPYKRLDLIVRAFHGLPEKKLVIIGDGPQADRIRPLLTPNITWLGYQPDEVLRDYLQRCRAFVFAAREDFGLLPVEAQACGAPVLAYGEGGCRETVDGTDHADPTGLYFEEQTVESIRKAVSEFERDPGRFTPANCRRKAEQFSTPRFREAIGRYVQAAWKEFESGIPRRLEDP